MLEKLISGVERPDVVLIEDCLQQSGRGLLKAFLVSLACRVNVIHLYLYELPPMRFTLGLSSSVMEKLTIHDMTNDLYGWISGSATLDVVPKQPQVPSGQRAALVFDYLGYLAQDKSPAFVCQMLHRLAGRTSDASANFPVEQIIAVVHRDVNDSAILRLLEYTASCVLSLSETVTEDGVSASVCRTVIKDPSGELRMSNEIFTLTKSFSVGAVEVLKPVAVQRSKPVLDPTSNLTFSLTLKKEEEEARRQVVLPYLSARTKGDSIVGESAAQGCTVYSSDDVDPEEELEEEDEEDPDDDLDI